MSKVQTSAALVGSASNDALATTRGRLDCSGADGGVVTYRMTNGATGPTAQAVARIMIAHKGDAMPAAGPEGAGPLDWKLVSELGGGVSALATTRGLFRFGREVAYVQVEFTGNTGQAVAVEAHATIHTDA